ncbi:sensor histidine kinase [Aestuariivirga sp. YIM B02566]|uniref:Sensor histidine kinase n=1 Tax=Taklimakanibacter albus TaxID=2800327 RepID=A0ACC5R849_9HYPH|nr:sensor histidine kinase [Aestuariivirga sp. YIM B02566]MBK1868794.1 sensor histidine kinase [Aestuariivirga sp. YIM B02566]
MKHFFNIRIHIIIVLSILFGCLASQKSSALQLNTADGIKDPVSLGGHLAVLHDPTGVLTIDDIISGRRGLDFKPIPSMLTEGYRKDAAVWVRFSLSAPTAGNQWLLQVERPLIEQVTLYVPDGAGRLAISPPRHVYPEDESEVRAYPNLFRISVPLAESEYYVRLQSSTSMTTSFNIWQERGYENYRRSDDWIMGIVVGAIGAMMLANLLYAAWLRDSLYLLYAAVLLEAGLLTVFHMGYAAELLFFLEEQQIYRSWGAIVCLYSVVMVLFLARLFELHRHGIWAWRVAQAIVLLNFIALLFAVAGHYGDVGLFVSRLQQWSFIFIALFALYLIMFRRQYQYLLPAIAFASVIAISLVMQMQYTGANPFRIDSSLARVMAVGILIHLVLLSAAVARRAQLAERSLSAEKDRAIALSRSAEQELTVKVRERTAELAERNATLNTEIDRRHLLEAKLRRSLDQVNDALAQQRNFVTLVSHDFRAPLAVIAAAAENLSLSSPVSIDNIKLRTTRIRQTVKRMSMLIENVLADERLGAGQAPPAVMEIFELNDVLRTARAALDDYAASRVSFILADEATVEGSPTLVEIALHNLIHNALKYTSATDCVIVRLSTDRGLAFIHVMDRGIGVAAEYHELVFMKYYRVPGQRAKGSGLGLYISREIARQHGGDLTLVASDARGSTFRLSLPLHRPGGALLPAAAQS